MKKALLITSLVLLIIALGLSGYIIHIQENFMHLVEYSKLSAIGAMGTFLIGTVYPRH